MHTLMRTHLLATTIIGLSAGAVSAHVVDFEGITLPPEGVYHRGVDIDEPWLVSNGQKFEWGYSEHGGQIFPYGFSVSNHTDTETRGPDNQWSAITGSGASGSDQYAIGNAFSPLEARIDDDPISIDITNTTYAYWAMREGDDFASQFADGDWFELTITGRDSDGEEVGEVVFALADFRDDAELLVDYWTTVDLTGLAGARSLDFSLASSDTGDFGMNTPAYFAADNLTLVPEPATLTLMALGALAGLRRPRRC